MTAERQTRPGSSRRFPRWSRSPALIALAVTALIALLASWHKGAYVLVDTIVVGGMWSLLALGLSLMFSVMNIPNFSYGEFFMIGTLAAYYIFNPINDYLFNHPGSWLVLAAPFLAVGGAMIAGAAAGAVAEKLLFYQLRKKTREEWLLNCFTLTVGLSVILINGHQLIFGADFKGIVAYWDVSAVPIFGVRISVERIFAFLLSLLAMIVFWVFLKFTQTGRAIRAVAENEAGAEMVGINTNSIQTLTMALSCGLGALAGGTLLFMFPSTPTVGIIPLFYGWFVVIAVGMGNLAGTVVGGFIVALVQVLTRVYIGEGLEFVVPSALMVLILLVKPSGILGAEVRGIWDR
ncbi:MAG: branched-chain amino acid ABC transporter permease [Thermodesulfobacteriota bacterium]